MTMPLDTRIPLMSQAAPVNVQPGMNALLGIQNMRQQQQEQPLRNQLLQTQIAGQQQTQDNSDRELKLKAAQFQNQAFKALKSIPDQNLRQMAYQSFVEHGKAMGIHDGNPDDDISDQGLDAGIAATQAFMPNDSLTPYQKASLGMQERSLVQRADESAADRALRERKIDVMGRAGSENPAAVKEWEYYKSLSPEQQKQYDAMKRGDRVTAGTENSILKTADAAEAERIKYENYSDLANQYEAAANMPSGITSTAQEWLKEKTGSQDAVSALRKDWAAIKASSVSTNLPPGPASDADVKMALSGFLPANANPKQVASFLRGVAKLSKIKGDYESFKSDYMSENRSTVGLNKAWLEANKSRESTLSSGNQQSTTQPPPAQGGPTQIKSDDDYNALPSGAEFIAPDGSHRRKP